MILINGRCLNGKITGIGTYTQNLAEGLKKAGLQITLFTKENDNLQILGPIYDYFIFGLKAKSNDTIINPHSSGSIISFARKNISVIHDLSVFDRPDLTPFINRVIIKLSSVIGLIFSHIVISDSQYTTSRISKIFPAFAKKVRTIYPGINITARNRQDISGRKTGKITIITLATHPKRKNIEGLKKAISISKYRNTIKLVITGINIGAENNYGIDVAFLGYVPRENLLKLLQESDLMVYPSIYEGFGYPVVEASLLGVPVLVSNVTSLPEVIGNKDLLFDPSDIENIRNKIDWWIELPEKTQDIYKKSQFLYATKFSQEKMISDYMQIL